MDVNNYDKSIWEFLPSITIDECKLKIKECEQQISELSTQNDDKQLVFELQVLEQRIREINSKLAQKTIKESAESRIRQLEKANKELAKLEQTNILKRKSIETYIIDLVKIANTSINSMFDNIGWNLFDTFNADAEKDIKEECEAMLKGKLYRQCSTGERLLVDFYTTLGLQKAFNVNLPIFFDEAQSSTFEKKCEQQLIELETRNTDTTNIGGKRIKLKGTK